MATASKARQRTRGEIETLPSGSLRVRVYAGIDPLSKKRHYLTATIPAGPAAAREAEKARTRLLAQVDDRRNPRTKATVNQLLDRYLEVLDAGETTIHGYQSNIRNHIRPVLGHLPLTRLDSEMLDSFYATLRRCREHCDGRGRQRDGHVCKPLAANTIRKVHTILSGACDRACDGGGSGSTPPRLRRRRHLRPRTRSRPPPSRPPGP